MSVFRNKTIQAYAAFGMLVLLVTAVAVKNLNFVTIKGWEINFSQRVDQVTVEKLFYYAGVYRLAQGKGKKVIHNLSNLKAPGSYLFCALAPNQKITQDTHIKLISYEVKEKKNLRKVPFRIKVKKTCSLPPGQTRVIQKGKTGLVEKIFRLTWKDGQLITNSEIAKIVCALPVEQIVEEGAPFITVSRGGKRGAGAKITPGAYAFSSTAYTHTGYRTATGIKPRQGVVAVDPKVIPLGTRMYIEGYGYAVAADTGGAIKGNKIDVFFETRAEAMKWGRRKVVVTVLA